MDGLRHFLHGGRGRPRYQGTALPGGCGGVYLGSAGGLLEWWGGEQSSPPAECKSALQGGLIRRLEP